MKETALKCGVWGVALSREKEEEGAFSVHCSLVFPKLNREHQCPKVLI